MKKTVTFHKINEEKDPRQYWLSKTPEERVEAVETIREHYYAMMGYTSPPRIKKIIKFS